MVRWNHKWEVGSFMFISMFGAVTAMLFAIFVALPSPAGVLLLPVPIALLFYVLKNKSKNK